MNRFAGMAAIFIREMQIFRIRLLRPTYVVSSLVTPLLYLLVFGLGLGRQVNFGQGNYLAFLLPGLVAMTAMSNAFTWVANSVNFSRFYYRTWALVILAPISPLQVCAGHIAAGIARGAVASLLIAAAGVLAGWQPTLTPIFIVTLVLELACFSALGLLVGLKTKHSEEHMAYSNFLITPMGFFCGTFFPLDSLPDWIASPLKLLPLTQATFLFHQPAISATAIVPLAALMGYFLVFSYLSVRAIVDYVD